MVFYKLILDTSIVKLINLRTVSHVQQNLNKITFTYNYNKTDGFIFLGSGSISHEPNTETIKLETQYDATKVMLGIEKAMEKL